MMVLVSYDVRTDSVGGARRLRRIAKLCLDHGVRVQYSIFECDISAAQWVQFKAKLLVEMNENLDSLRFYKLGRNWQNKVEHYGAKPAPDIYNDTLII